MKIASIQPIPPTIEDQTPILPRGISIGGGETASFKFSKLLAQDKNKVFYLTGKYPGIQREKVKINKNLNVEYLHLLMKDNYVTPVSFKLVYILLTRDLDLIISHQIPTYFSLIGAIISKLRNKKFVVFFHGQTPHNKIELLIAKTVCLLATLVIVQNKFAYKTVKKYSYRKNIRFLSNSVDTSIFSKREVASAIIKNKIKKNEKIILFSGRLIPAKGVGLLLKAFKILKSKISAKLVIIGDGPIKHDLVKYANKLGIQKNVHFIGFVAQDELPNYYSEADVLVLPSTSYDMDGNPLKPVQEIFPLVLLEAMACQLPIIASHFGGIPEFIENNINGILVKEQDYVELANKINELLSNDKMKKKLIKSGLKDVNEKYSFEVIYKQFINFLN